MSRTRGGAFASLDRENEFGELAGMETKAEGAPTAGEHAGFIIALAVSSDLSRIYYADAARGDVHVVSAVDGRPVAAWTVSERPVMDLVVGDEGEVVCACLDGTVSALSAQGVCSGQPTWGGPGSTACTCGASG